MPVRTVLQLGDPLLREVCTPVPDPTAPAVAVLVADLADTLAHWRRETGYGRGIAAPQLGVLSRVVFLHLPGREPWPLVNPEIVEQSGQQRGEEGCLSVPGIYDKVERAQRVVVRYLDLDGKEQTVVAEGILSVCLQHEIDHLQGRVFVEHLSQLKQQRIKSKLSKQARITA